MSVILHGIRHARQGMSVLLAHPPPFSAARSIHIPTSHPYAPPPPTLTQHLFSQTRTLISRLLNHLTTPHIARAPVPHSTSKSLLRPTYRYSSAQSIRAGFSLPVRHFLSKPLSPPHLPRAPAVPGNVTHVGLGTARAFHSSRPIFQNLVENVPVSTRTLWEAEWEVKMKRKGARKLRTAKETSAPVPKLQDKLKPRSQVQTSEVQDGGSAEPSELDVYFPLQNAPAVMTYLLIPLAPTPTARLPLSSQSADDTIHPLLPFSELMSTHYHHRLHALRVSTLFARLDTANVWDEPGAGYDAYAGRIRLDMGTCGYPCTILRVSFPGWDASRVRAVVGDSIDDWCALEETRLPTASAHSGSRVETASFEPAPSSAAYDSLVSELELDKASEAESPDYDLWQSLPITATASAHHELVLPTLDFSSSFSEAVHAVALQSPLNRLAPPRPASELADHAASYD